ncbi:MAG: HAD hydrolase-like protein [Succiniclasticum sp.]|jgi:pyrophosphatase PpaX|nr:HAD hydrolase-like protein [Succiniclasticum sp.]MEE3478499.1 HAD hydrolase-like protein [Succiniclasticum sp.]
MIQGILFDFDGTLADTSPVIFDCYAYATEKVLGHKAPLQPYLETFGQPLRPSLVRLFGAEKGNTICDVYRARQDVVHDRLIQPFPGVRETLEALRARHLPVAVVTSKLNKTCRRGLRCVGLEEFFDCVISSDLVSRPKPDPDGALRALEALGLAGRDKKAAPGTVLMVGDSPFDMLCGRGAGCETVAVEYTLVDRNTLAATHPDHWIGSMPELLQLIDRLDGRPEPTMEKTDK